jgi:glycosyltransferase involved in cell wall biosynthesis
MSGDIGKRSLAKKLLIITSHPIQYQAPLWQKMAQAAVPMEVLFLCPHGMKETVDPEFDRSFAWDLPMLEEYKSRFLEIPGWDLKAPMKMKIKMKGGLKAIFEETGATHLWVEGWRFPAFWQAVRQAKKAGLQVWCRGESNDLAPEPMFPKSLVKKALMSWFFNKVDAFLCIGQANRRLYQKAGVPERKMHSAPYFVDNERFSREAERLWPEREKIRATWGIRPDACVVLYSGKFIPKKRVMDLARAFRAVCERHPGKFHLLLAGEGPQRHELERKLAGLSVSFTGFLNQTEIPRAYAAADVMVMASDWGETWGLSANEALASGVPVILSNKCGCAEDLSSATREAQVFEMGNVKQLAELIEDGRWQMADGDSAKIRRKNLMKVMRERFDAENTIATVKRLLV